MKAVRLHGFGGVDQLRLDDVPVPTPGIGEVRIKVGAAAVNPFDWKIRKQAIPGVSVPLPFILGGEGVGTISALGAGVTDFQVGQRVWGFTEGTRGGWYAEEVVMPVTQISFAAPKLSDAEAASLPLGAVLAMQAFERAGLQAGQRILIIGGAGSIGSVAIQIARQQVAWIYATGSARNQEFLTEIGANKALDYSKDNIAEEAHDVDIVLDTVGGSAAEVGYAALKEGGQFISIVSPPDPEKLAARKASGFMHIATPDALKLINAAAFTELQSLRPNVAEIFRLHDAARAQAMSETGHVRGKLILVP